MNAPGHRDMVSFIPFLGKWRNLKCEFSLTSMSCMKHVRRYLLISGLLLIWLTQPGMAATVPAGWQSDATFTASTVAWQAQPLRLVQGQKDENQQKEPRPGSLVLPAAAETEKTEKQCMTVCSRWGEECTFINRGSGGLSKKCRRACKQFSEECF